jgi:hypothetical protein
MALTVKILGDQHFSEVINHVNVTEIMGMSYSFTQVTTLTSLSLEVDAKGSENILILGCLSSVLEIVMSDEGGSQLNMVLDNLRLTLDSYFVRTHDVYAIPPLSRSPDHFTRHRIRNEALIQV